MFRYFLVLDVEQNFEYFLGSTGLLDEGALLELTSIFCLVLRGGSRNEEKGGHTVVCRR